MKMQRICASLICAMPFTVLASARFTPVIEGAPESIVQNGYVVNLRRVAVQKELVQRPPTTAELGVKLPPKAALQLETTARQIAQYHPVWRVYEYKTGMPRTELIQFFEAQGLRFDAGKNKLLFPGIADADRAEFIDGLNGAFRVWRRP